MADSMFYCEVNHTDTWEFKPGVYAIPDRKSHFTKIRRCMSYSHRVWIQGPKGGVRLRDGFNIFRYVTKDEELMKQFMWAKLKAQSLKNYT